MSNLLLHSMVEETLRGGGGCIEILPEYQWKVDVTIHPYPEVSIEEAHRPVLPCSVDRDMGEIYVDAGTGKRFKGSFPMTPVRLLDPDGKGEIGGHIELIAKVVEGFLDYLDQGEKMQQAIAVPFLRRVGGVTRWNDVWFYGAFCGERKELYEPFSPFTCPGIYWNEEVTRRKGDTLSAVVEARRIYSFESQEDADERAEAMCRELLDKPTLEP